MKLSSLFLSAAGAAALLAVPAAASAAPDHCPPGHAKKGWCAAGYGHHARYRADRGHHRYDHRPERRDEARAYREGYEDGRREALRRGHYIPHGANYRVIEDYRRYGYDQPPYGYQYAEVDGEVLMVQIATQLIAQALTGTR